MGKESLAFTAARPIAQQFKHDIIYKYICEKEQASQAYASRTVVLVVVVVVVLSV